MFFLDLIHLFFKPQSPIKDENSVLGKEWRMTLQYALHQPGLKDAYTTDLTDGYDIWVFLVWETEHHRAYFYHQTSGFGFMSHHMYKPPSVLLFGGSSYTELDRTNDWTISVLSAEDEDAQDPKRSHDKIAFNRLRDRCDFVARQEKETTARLYQGGLDFNSAIAALTGRDRWNLNAESQWKHHFVKLEACKRIAYPHPFQVAAPLDIAELTTKQPWEYGVLPSDDSQYSDAAYPMSLTFRPMSTIGSVSTFQQEHADRSVPETIAEGEYAVCIILVQADPSRWSRHNEKPIEDLRTSLGLQDGAVGLCELSVLRVNDGGDNEQTVRFLCVWETSSDFSQWRQRYITDDENEHKVTRSPVVPYSWRSSVRGLQQLEWEEMPLTSDKQSYQAVDKILELVEFTFAQSLALVEREAFIYRLQSLINAMSSTWSGDMDARPVVYAENPVWTEETHVPSKCLLLLAWDGIEQRAAWLRNFMAHDFNWTGHIAHALGVICSNVESATFKMEKLYTEPSYQALPSILEAQDQEHGEGDSSDFEGF